MPEITGDVNPYRILEGLAASGYTPESAICDIVDNSMTWGADKVWIELEKDPTLARNRPNNARKYIIADSGIGMDKSELENALALGSEAVYLANSLTRFGLGLTTAAFSQGRRLDVFTKKTGSSLLHGLVDLDVIREHRAYIIAVDEISEPATGYTLIDDHFQKNPTGTIVVISNIRTVNHPSVKVTADALQYRLGAIYQFYLIDGRQMWINNALVQPFDPLFVDEAKAEEQARGGNAPSPLVDMSWTGRTVQWLLKPVSVVLDPDQGVTARLEATQLPHPPTFGFEGERKLTGDKYRIGAGDYGLYVYRNNRLISSAEHFGNLIPQDQDLYSFRGRLFIDGSADQVMNIDLKKSRVMLSEAARKALDDALDEPLRQSREGWRLAGCRLKEKSGQDPDSAANLALSDVDLPEELPTDPGDARSEQQRNERKYREIERHRFSAGEAEAIEKSGRRVIFVPTLDDDVLWERSLDPELGVIVRMNSSHRFVREVYGRFRDDPNVTLILHSLFLSLANGESYAIRTFGKVPDEMLEEIFHDLRYAVSRSIYSVTADVLAKQLAG